VSQVPRFHQELREALRAEGTVLKAIIETRDLSDETVEALKKAVDGFKEGFFVEEEHGLAAAAS
jgi:F-type H+/Na+-transporting ATPase subunit alpha